MFSFGYLIGCAIEWRSAIVTLPKTRAANAQFVARSARAPRHPGSVIPVESAGNKTVNSLSPGSQGMLTSCVINLLRPPAALL